MTCDQIPSIACNGVQCEGTSWRSALLYEAINSESEIACLEATPMMMPRAVGRMSFLLCVYRFIHICEYINHPT